MQRSVRSRQSLSPNITNGWLFTMPLSRRPRKRETCLFLTTRCKSSGQNSVSKSLNVTNCHGVIPADTHTHTHIYIYSIAYTNKKPVHDDSHHIIQVVKGSTNYIHHMQAYTANPPESFCLGSPAASKMPFIWRRRA